MPLVVVEVLVVEGGCGCPSCVKKVISGQLFNLPVVKTTIALFLTCHGSRNGRVVLCPVVLQLFSLDQVVVKVLLVGLSPGVSRLAVARRP